MTQPPEPTTGALKKRLAPDRVLGLERQVDQLQLVVQQRAAVAIAEAIDGLNVLVQRAGQGDRGAHAQLRQLHQLLDRARLLSSLELPAEPAPNGGG